MNSRRFLKEIFQDSFAARPYVLPEAVEAGLRAAFNGRALARARYVAVVAQGTIGQVVPFDADGHGLMEFLARPNREFYRHQSIMNVAARDNNGAQAAIAYFCDMLTGHPG